MFFRKKEEVTEEVEKPKKNVKKEEEFEWDKRRIITTLFFGVVVLLLVLELKNKLIPNTGILGESTVKKSYEIKKPEVQGPNLDVESKVGTAIEDIKSNINEINPEEVASSSPQIQKVLQDIQGLKDLPSDKARSTCLKLCSEL
jgi:hypothetical protein